MLTEEEKKHIEASAESGTLLPSDLKTKYIDELLAGPPFPGALALECCILTPGATPFPIRAGHCKIVGGTLVDATICGLAAGPGNNIP